VDTAARTVGSKLAEILGQPVVVDNRPGGNTTIGMANVAKAPADGYTIGITSLVHYMNPFFSKNVPYDALKDFTPIAQIGAVADIVAVNPAVPIHSVKELIEYANKNPGKLMYGSPGFGSREHLGGLLLSRAAGIELQNIPYKGGGQAIIDAMGGQLPMVILASPSVTPQMRAGKLRALAVIDGQRSPSAPEIPTIGETIPGFAVPTNWIGILGPAGMPKAVVDRLNSTIRKITTLPEIKRSLEAKGYDVLGDPPDPEAFLKSVKADTEVIRKIVTAAGIQPE